MLIDLIETNKNTIFEQAHGQDVIQTSHKRAYLLNAVEVIQQFNETIQPYLT